MPTLTIDGREITVEAGTSVIDAATQAGVTIPHYCYHPKLSIAGNCRMCLVDIEGARRPEISCNTAVRDGMVVKTDTEKIQHLRKGVLEFLFLNHPIDCPVCDKAGECKLQDYYLEHGKYESRLDENKVRKPKRLDIGKHIILDAERCVLCSRCIRFCNEVTKTGELSFQERGSHMQIGIHPERRLDNRYSMCTTDICPVGALTSKPFRFQARVWFLDRTQSVCTGCAKGCNVEIHSQKGNIKRYMPRRNDSVNETWMCDDGRLSYADIQGEDRLLESTIQGTGAVSLGEALQQAASNLQNLQGDGQIALILSPRASTEDNVLLSELAMALGKRAALYLVGGNPPGSPENDEDGILIQADKNPNSNGAKLVASLYKAQGPGQLKLDVEKGTVKGLVILANDIIGKTEGMKDIAQVFAKVDALIAFDNHANSTTSKAKVVLPIGVHAESDGTFVNHDLRIQAFKKAVEVRGDATPTWKLIPKLAEIMGLLLPERSPAQLFDGFCQAHPHLDGVTFESLGEGGLSLKPSSESAA